MKRLSKEKRAQVIRALTEGCSVNATTRMTGVSKPTILKLLVDIGRVCADYQDKAFRNLTCKRIEVDELWSFCGMKARNVPTDKKGVFGYGDTWTWVAIDPESKLVPSWLVGRRDAICASEFLTDLAERLANRVQLTSDGNNAYLVGVEAAFGSEVDYSMLIKLYGKPQDEHRYSPPQCIGIRMNPVIGDPDPDYISTSIVERQNLSVRMRNRRFTRLTNGHSKKLENHAAAMALHYMVYNYVRIHGSLRMTPAMAAGVTDRVWDVEDIIVLLEAVEPKGQRRGYKKQRAS